MENGAILAQAPVALRPYWLTLLLRFNIMVKVAPFLSGLHMLSRRGAHCAPALWLNGCLAVPCTGSGRAAAVPCAGSGRAAAVPCAGSGRAAAVPCAGSGRAAGEQCSPLRVRLYRPDRNGAPRSYPGHLLLPFGPFTLAHPAVYIS